MISERSTGLGVNATLVSVQFSPLYLTSVEAVLSGKR